MSWRGDYLFLNSGILVGVSIFTKWTGGIGGSSLVKLGCWIKFYVSLALASSAFRLSIISLMALIFAWISIFKASAIPLPILASNLSFLYCYWCWTIFPLRSCCCFNLYCLFSFLMDSNLASRSDFFLRMFLYTQLKLWAGSVASYFYFKDSSPWTFGLVSGYTCCIYGGGELYWGN